MKNVEWIIDSLLTAGKPACSGQACLQQVNLLAAGKLQVDNYLQLLVNGD